MGCHKLLTVGLGTPLSDSNPAPHHSQRCHRVMTPTSSVPPTQHVQIELLYFEAQCMLSRSSL